MSRHAADAELPPTAADDETRSPARDDEGANGTPRAAGDAAVGRATDPAADAYRAERAAHWDRVACAMRDRRRAFGGTYHRRLEQVYGLLVPPGQRVLEIGCGDGSLLASLRPSVGVGVDLSPEMVGLAAERHPAPSLRFIAADAHALDLGGETFDTIVLSDVVNDLWDVQAVLERLAPLCTPDTRVILNFYSHLWQWPLALAQRLGMARPTLLQNWLTVPDLNNLLHLGGYEPLRHWQEVLWPVPTPGVQQLMNKVLVRFPPFSWGAMTNFLVARPARGRRVAAGERPPRVSVIVPARNESGNVEAIFDRVPEMGSGTELLFVEGNSTDDTRAAIRRGLDARPGRDARLLVQTGRGKGDAVRLGFAEASGEILMILDADLTVPPEDLPRFVEALASNKGEFVNGVRLVYPMEKRAMRLLNLAGNKFFSAAFSWLLGQPVKDTLCGTKVLWKRDYERIAANRAYFGDFDPFGDFDLLFGAAKLNLKIVDLPVRYRERTYGETNIHRWRHGWLLIKMVAFASTRMKFV